MSGLLDSVAANALAGLLAGIPLVLVVAAAMPLARRAPAATRATIWGATIAALLLLPVAGALRAIRGGTTRTSPIARHELAPAVAAPPLLSAHDGDGEHGTPGEGDGANPAPWGVSDTVPEEPAAETGDPAAGNAAVDDGERAAGAEIRGAVPRLAIRAFFLAWLAAAAVSLVRIASGVRGALALKERGEPFRVPLSGRVAARLAAASGRRFDLLESDEVPTPVTIGFVRPAVLVPPELAGELPAGDLERVLVHETAHLRRRDDWTRLAERIAVALVPFHPGLRLAARRLDLEREAACDEVAAGAEPAEFAGALVRLAALRNGLPLPQSALGAAPRPSDLRRRIEMLLDPERRPASASSRAVAFGGAALVAVLLAFGFAVPVVAVSDGEVEDLFAPLPQRSLRLARAVEPPPPAGKIRVHERDADDELDFDVETGDDEIDVDADIDTAKLSAEIEREMAESMKELDREMAELSQNLASGGMNDREHRLELQRQVEEAMREAKEEMQRNRQQIREDAKRQAEEAMQQAKEQIRQAREEAKLAAEEARQEARLRSLRDEHEIRAAVEERLVEAQQRLAEQQERIAEELRRIRSERKATPRGRSTAPSAPAPPAAPRTPRRGPRGTPAPIPDSSPEPPALPGVPVPDSAPEPPTMPPAAYRGVPGFAPIAPPKTLPPTPPAAPVTPVAVAGARLRPRAVPVAAPSAPVDPFTPIVPLSPPLAIVPARPAN